MKTTKNSLLLLLVASAVIALFATSCRNTLHGAGRDIENANDHIERARH